ncbi:MAG TPA: DUF4157 domain-containing protein, partial [Kofleriaceae bacterium]|nr:DUF4157 domain-containing protein [Kofleriaceae bacterium]
MSDPAGGGPAKLDPQAAIAKHAAITQAGAGADAAIIARVENAIQHSPMGWLQSVLGEADSRASSERSQVQAKVDESKSLVAQNKDQAPKDAGHPPAPGPAAHPAVPNPTPAAHGGETATAKPATAASGGATATHLPGVGAASKPAQAAAPAAATAATTAALPAPIAAAIASGSSDPQLDALLDAYQPKNPATEQTLGRIREMGAVAQGFNGQLDVYVAQGGAVEHAVASASNFLGMGKDVGAVWANNPYKQMSGVLGRFIQGLSAIKSVTNIVGSICGKLGLVLTVVGLLGMIFPPIGAAVSGIARILNVIGVICSAISFVLAGVLTGFNGVELAQQIRAGASAEEKAATADMMMSEANEAAGGFINMAAIFGPRFAKGLMTESRGVVSSLFRRAKASIGRVSLKLNADVSHVANRLVRGAGFGGVGMERIGGVAGEWKDTGIVARTGTALRESRAGQAFYGAPRHIEAIQDKLMARYGTSGFAKGLDRVGAWSGSVAHKIDLEEKVGSWGQKSGAALGTFGAETTLGKNMAAAADRAEFGTRQAAMHAEARDAAHLEEQRWRRAIAKKQVDPEEIGDNKQAFIRAQGDKVRQDKLEAFQQAEQKRDIKQRIEDMRAARFERQNDDYFSNKTSGLSGTGARDRYMDTLHSSRERRFELEDQLHAQDDERRTLLATKTRTPEQDTKLTELNAQLAPLDEARRRNKAYELELSGMAGGASPVRAPEYKDWRDVGQNVWDSSEPMLEMMHWKQNESAFAASEKYELGRPLKWDKASAKGGAAAAGGHDTYAQIATDARRQQQDDFAAFVRSAPAPSGLSAQVRGMLGGVRAPIPATPAPAAAPAPAPAPTAAIAPAMTNVAVNGAINSVAAEPTVAPAAAPAAAAGPAVAEVAPDALPYWPAMMPQLDSATHDFGYMRAVAVEFRKAQIEGKQKAVDTLAVYGRYQEYAKLRQAAAAQHQQTSASTASGIQQNVSSAGQSEQQGAQGQAKQGEAASAAQDKAAVDLPEPESRGFWDRILGGVKRWAKNKAQEVFGWIQEQIASVVLKGLCGVSMGDLREYGGALRRQQLAAHGVADGAAQTSARAQQASIKLGADASKDAQDAAGSIAECDRNIVDADTFMQDLVSFEQQLAEEKAHAQAFLAQVHAAAHMQQMIPGASHAAAAAAAPVAAAAPMAAPVPTFAAPIAATATAAASEPAAPETADASQIHAAADLVAGSTERMTSQLETRADDYKNQLAIALTNHTGKDQAGHDLKGPADKESKHVVEEFKHSAQTTKRDMEKLHDLAIDPSSARRIADVVIASAAHLEGDFHEAEHGLDELFARTYQGIRDGQRTLKSRMLDGDNLIGHVNQRASSAEDRVNEAALPTLDHAWGAVTTSDAPAKPVQMKAMDERSPDQVAGAATAAVDQRGSGQAVDAQLAAQVGAHFGADLSQTRVHSDPHSQAQTRAMGARAFAHGDDVYLGPGQSASDTTLMAHELSHVAQQKGGEAAVQRKVEVGAQNSPAEHQADQVAEQAAGGTLAPAHLIVDAGPLAPGQELKTSFLDRLKPMVTDVANTTLGRLGSATSCPYILFYFAKYSGLPAESLEAVIHRWIPASVNARSAEALYALISDRVRGGVEHWARSGKLPPELGDADPSLAATAQTAHAGATAGGAMTAPGAAQAKSLDALEADLGPGQAVDPKVAAPYGAEGVKIHTGPTAHAKAAEVDAAAFAVGDHVVMGAGAPKQGTIAGDALLAHELAHTAQQRDAAKDPVARAKPIGAEDHAAEVDADRVASLGMFAGRVGDVMRTGVQLQRCHGSVDEGVDVKTYIDENMAAIANGAATIISTLPFATGDAALTWANGGDVLFRHKLAAQLTSGPDLPDLESLVRPDSLTHLVEEARIQNERTYEGSEGPKTMPTGKGPEQYFFSVGAAVGNALARRTAESLQREAPRYAQARMALSGEPPAASIIASHPIDPLVLTALTVGNVLDIDRKMFAKEHPDLAGPPPNAHDLRHIDLKEEVPNQWWRVKGSYTPPATAEEVAKSLGMDPTEAFRFEVAYPLFGRHADTRVDIAQDPLQGATTPAMSDEIALNQAASLKHVDMPAPAVIKQMSDNATMLRTSVRASAQKFGLTRALDPLAQIIADRAARLQQQGQPSEIAKWSTQVMAQAKIISDASGGLEADNARLESYSTQYKVDLRQDPAAFGLPDEHRQALRADAELWVDALEVSDDVTSARQRLAVAAQHCATLDIEIMERQLGSTQQAVYNGQENKSDTVNKDFDPASLGPRENQQRLDLAKMRAELLANPLGVDPNSKKVAQDNEELVFESHVVLQAESVDQAWHMIDESDGFWAYVTLEASKLKALKTEGSGYYQTWREVYQLIKDQKKDEARKKYQELCANGKLQTFLKRVSDAVQEAQKRALFGKLIAMVVICVASMGTGILVEGFLGGGAVVAEGATAVTEGVGMSRNVAAVAGFVAETAMFTGLSNAAFEKDHSVTAILTDFGKNLVLFGAMRGIGKVFEAAGAAKLAEAAAKNGASLGTKSADLFVQTFQAVVGGGVAYVASLAEAKVRAAMAGKQLSDAEVQEMIRMNVAQTIIMFVVGRAMASPMRSLKMYGAYQGSKWRMASEANTRMEGFARALHGNHTVSDAQLRDLMNKDVAELEQEKAAFEQVRDNLAAAKKDTGDIDAHLKELDKNLDQAETLKLTLGLKQENANHFKCDPTQIDEVLARHEKQSGQKATVVDVDPLTGAETYAVKTANGDTIYISEDLPAWA